MKTTEMYKNQIIKETRSISRYAGLLCGRLLLLFLLFILLLCSFSGLAYFFAFLLIVPGIFSMLLEKKRADAPILLNSSARRFFYTDARFKAEQHIGRCIILLLTFWQVTMSQTSDSILTALTPGILLLLYLFCRILSTSLIRHSIHRYYHNLTALD